MKKLSINTKNGVKNIDCFKYDGSYESFKTIWNTIHDQMMLIALKYKEKYELNIESINTSSAYVYAIRVLEMWLYKDVDAAWKQALLIDGWYQSTIDNHNIKEYFWLDNLFVLTAEIPNKKIIFKQLCIANNDNGSYLLIDPDNIIDGLYVSEMDFIDDFFLGEE